MRRKDKNTRPLLPEPLPMSELKTQIMLRVGKRNSEAICRIIAKLESNRMKGGK